MATNRTTMRVLHRERRVESVIPCTQATYHDGVVTLYHHGREDRDLADADEGAVRITQLKRGEVLALGDSGKAVHRWDLGDGEEV